MGKILGKSIEREIRVQMADAVRLLDPVERGLKDKITFEPTAINMGKDLYKDQAAFRGTAKREVTTQGGSLVAVREYPFYGQMQTSATPEALKGLPAEPQHWAPFGNGQVEGKFLRLDRSLADVRIERALDAMDAAQARAGAAARRVDKALQATPVINQAYAPVRKAAIATGNAVGKAFFRLLDALQPNVPHY